MMNYRIGRLVAILAAMAIAMRAQCVAARAETALVAVASNFVEPLNALAKSFETETGHTLKISSGSTGQLYAQIKHGAPFDVFLAADDERPRKLEEEGVAVSGSSFTYAIGQLMLWCPSRQSEAGGELFAILDTAPAVAIANPQLAPYGKAAQQTLDRHGVWNALKPRIVFGQNIAQVFALVGTGNAQCGLVARSQMASANALAKGTAIAIDPSDHDPIHQDGLLLKRAESNPAANAFIDYLKSPAARKIIAGFGYLEGGD